MTFTATANEGRMRRTHSMSSHEYEFLRSITRQTPKITMPSPSTMHFWRGDASFDSSVYPTLAEYLADLVEIYRAEIADLAALGATYIQLDEVVFAMMCDPNVRSAVTARGEDTDELMTVYLDASNAALTSRPESVAASYHVCRGNYKGHWLATGGYEPVAERVFGGLAVDAFFLEFDSERAGGFAPLRFVPDGVDVVLGLVSSKSPELESADDLVRRIEEAAEYVPIERLGISPQCGFASTAGGNPLTEDDERRKLARGRRGRRPRAGAARSAAGRRHCRHVRRAARCRGRLPGLHPLLLGPGLDRDRRDDGAPAPDRRRALRVRPAARTVFKRLTIRTRNVECRGGRPGGDLS